MKRAEVVLLLVLAACIGAEIAWSWRRDRKVYNLKESMSNLAMLGVNNALKPAALAWGLLVMSLLEPLRLFELPTTVSAFAVTFVVADFAYYWYHRLNHELPLLWTMHHTHHSSPWLNLSTAVRLNWLGKFASPLFFAPLVLLGLSPLFISASLALGLLFQFFLHTEAIGRLGWLEGRLINTPSAHRVHHGSNAQYIDKNYAGVFIVWDRIFGTYEPEVEPVEYGVTTGFMGHSPLVVQLRPLIQYIRGHWRREKHIAAERSATKLLAR